MLASAGFDMWANGYDASVGLSDEADSYPFAGYKKVLGGIYGMLREKKARRVLDVGCGTGVLGAKLCAAGLDVTGIDFSEQMLKVARERMPEARLIQWDFSAGLPEKVKTREYDAVISTYAVHHLTDEDKGMLLSEMTACVRPGGLILIGDIAFETAKDREDCRRTAGDWDGEEHYMVMDEMREHMVGSIYSYHQMSVCAGVLSIIV